MAPPPPIEGRAIVVAMEDGRMPPSAAVSRRPRFSALSDSRNTDSAAGNIRGAEAFSRNPTMSGSACSEERGCILD
jgi:hypothetical protein